MGKGAEIEDPEVVNICSEILLVNILQDCDTHECTALLLKWQDFYKSKAINIQEQFWEELKKPTSIWGVMEDWRRFGETPCNIAMLI